MYCRECGNPVPDGARFCGECGASMPEAQPAAHAAPTAPAAHAAPTAPTAPAAASASVSASASRASSHAGASAALSKVLLFAGVACALVLMLLALVASIGSVKGISQEIATYPDDQAVALALICGIVMGALLVLSALSLCSLLSKLSHARGDRVTGAPLAVVCLAIALAICLVTFIAGLVLSSSVVAVIPMALYLLSTAYAGVEPFALVLCACAVACAACFASSARKGSR